MERIDLDGAVLAELSLRGVRVRNADLTGAKFSDGLLVDADLSGLIDGLMINGIEVAPLIWAEMVRRDPDLAFTRSDDLGDLRRAWSVVKARWSDTTALARTLPEEARQQRVDDEWSFVETLRHLVFVTDAWVSRVVLGAARPYHPLGLPPSFLADTSTFGIDAGAHPSFDEVLAARADRQRIVDDVLGELTQDTLGRRCAPNPASGYPPNTEVSVVDCVRTVLIEEWAHHGYAVRDLAL